MATSSWFSTGTGVWTKWSAGILRYSLTRGSSTMLWALLWWSQKSCLEHPSPAGWVCVYLLKRSKTCILPWWSFTWTYFISDSSTGFYMVNRGKWIFSSVLDEQGGTPYSDVECPTKRASLWADMKKGRFVHVPASRDWHVHGDRC